MGAKTLVSICAAGCVFLGAFGARANMVYNRWFSLSWMDERDVAIMIQLIEEDPPSFDTTFTLMRGEEVLFEHRMFEKEEADQVEGYGCIEDYNSSDPVDDCDGDGEADCAGICGTAYRYEYVDYCVPGERALYTLYDEATFDDDGRPTDDGYRGGFELAENPDDSCMDDSSCSASPRIGRASERGLAVLMLLIGLGALFMVRRRGAPE